MIENLLEKDKKTDIFTSVILVFVMIVILAAVCWRSFFSFTRVDGESMMNTLKDEQYVVLLKQGFSPKRGDIVTIDREKFNGNKEPLIKRVIALEGDRLLFMYDASGNYIDVYLCKNGENTFKLHNEPYTAERMKKNNYKSISIIRHIPDISEIALDGDDDRLIGIESCQIKVPDGQFFFMGDNRNHSNDSRGDYSTFDCSDIIGKVIKIVEPDSAAHKTIDFLFGSATA